MYAGGSVLSVNVGLCGNLQCNGMVGKSAKHHANEVQILISVLWGVFSGWVRSCLDMFFFCTLGNKQITRD